MNSTHTQTPLKAHATSTLEQKVFGPLLQAAAIAFRCGLHGTVKECPWRFMDCTQPEDTSAPRLDEESRRKLAAELASELY